MWGDGIVMLEDYLRLSSCFDPKGLGVRTDIRHRYRHMHTLAGTSKGLIQCRSEGV